MIDAGAYFNANPEERQLLRALDAAMPEINVVDDIHGGAPFHRARRKGCRGGGKLIRSAVGYYSDDESSEELVVVNMKPETEPGMLHPPTAPRYS